MAHFRYSKRRTKIQEYCQKYLNQSSDLLEVNLNPKWKGEPSLQPLEDNTSVLVNWTGVIYNAKGKVIL